MHKLSKGQAEKVQESESNKDQTNYLIQKSIIYGVIFCVAIGCINY
jgi:hypothetical protein